MEKELQLGTPGERLEADKDALVELSETEIALVSGGQGMNRTNAATTVQSSVAGIAGGRSVWLS
ncbi:hypothetical protein [Pandoraea pnomenusa]|uniref:hypothetical protein n=1 Tax=Pandoraea pnomenusa TaxID=93220 RepID=UPI003342D480